MPSKEWHSSNRSAMPSRLGGDVRDEGELGTDRNSCWSCSGDRMHHDCWESTD